jgi:hypothetical protein
MPTPDLPTTRSLSIADMDTLFSSNHNYHTPQPPSPSFIPQITPEMFLYALLGIILVYYVLPNAVRYKKNKEKDPTPTNSPQTTADSFKEGLAIIAQSINAQTRDNIELKVLITEHLTELRVSQIALLDLLKQNKKSGILDEEGTIKQFFSSIQHSMTRMLLLYFERTEENHIKTERHQVYGRYQREAKHIAGKLYDEVSPYTCMANTRKLSGFFNKQGADEVFMRIADELFNNQDAISEPDPVLRATHYILNKRDVKLALDRFTSEMIGRAKKWIEDDTKTMSKSWNKAEKKFRFEIEPDPISFLGDEYKDEEGSA